jgi:nicotinate phosphoribosyltransferase
MASSIPPPPLVTSALGLSLDAYVGVRAAIAAGIADARAAFELTLAAPSPEWGFLVVAGVEPLVDALERLRPRVDELDWLAAVAAIDAPTRRKLAEGRFSCDVDAAPEGSVVFPGEAIVTLEGPYWQAQLVGGLVEAAITEATMVATRFARLSLASRGADLVEHGAATAHRLGGAPLLARAAYVGGAHATTSALAGRRYGIPVTAMQPARFAVGTGSDDAAMRAWLAASPSGGILRFDESRGKAGIARIAAAVKERVRASGSGWDESRVAIELPSGDRVGLARELAREFARVGLAEPPVLVSGEVDERMALELRAVPSPIRGFAVRTEGMAGSALLAHFELTAIEQQGSWSSRLRVGPDVASSSDPGRKLLVRYVDADTRPVADVAHMTNERILRAPGGRFIDRTTGLSCKLPAASSAPLRASVMRAGKRASTPEVASALRDRAMRAVHALDEGHRRLSAPARYPVGMSSHLAELKEELLAKAAE